MPRNKPPKEMPEFDPIRDTRHDRIIGHMRIEILTREKMSDLKVDEIAQRTFDSAGNGNFMRVDLRFQ